MYKHIGLNLAVSQSLVFSYVPFFTWNETIEYTGQTIKDLPTADGNLKFPIFGCGYKQIFVELLTFKFFRNRKSKLQNSSEKQAYCD